MTEDLICDMHASLWYAGVNVSYTDIMSMPVRYFCNLVLKYYELRKEKDDG